MPAYLALAAVELRQGRVDKVEEQRQHLARVLADLGHQVL